jgi:hypothetical protein
MMLARPIFLDHLRADDVRGHQIGGELNTVEFEVDGFSELLDDEGLCQAWDASEQAVPSREEGDQDFADDALLADDDFGELALEPSRGVGHTIEGCRGVAAVRDVKAALGHCGILESTTALCRRCRDRSRAGADALSRRHDARGSSRPIPASIASWPSWRRGRRACGRAIRGNRAARKRCDERL